MIRLVNMGTGWIGVEIDSVLDDHRNIEEFASEGHPVVIVDELSSAKDELGLDPDEINMAE